MVMGIKITITETQLKTLKTVLNENHSFSLMVKRMKAELDKNYTPVNKFVRKGGEYHDEPMIMVNVDKETITPKELYNYMKYKYKMGDLFTKQVIRDWVDDEISDDFMLSKNVPMFK